MGRARYLTELAKKKHYGLSEGYREVICHQLPLKYDEAVYMNFLETWGTHFIIEVDVGTKKVKKIENTIGDMFSMASRDMSTGAVKAGGEYKGVSASLEFNMDNFKNSETTRKWDKGKITEYEVGTKNSPEPISLVIKEISNTLNDEFWTVGKDECSDEDRKGKKKLIIQALENYAEWNNVQPPKETSLKIPITWPTGTYALPQTSDICPTSDKFTWVEGYIIQTSGSSTKTVPEKIHWPKFAIHKIYKTIFKYLSYTVKQNFCLKSKAKATSYSMEFPPGRYCVFKVGDCPGHMFENGSITWSDYNSKVSTKGYLPEGDYYTSGLTTIEYCCRGDGLASNPIFLPTDKPFYLLRFKGQCQRVNGMAVRDEMVKWQPYYSDKSTRDGVHPDITSVGDIELHYCYYSKPG